jgi:serine/threonine-protein kinase
VPVLVAAVALVIAATVVAYVIISDDGERSRSTTATAIDAASPTVPTTIAADASASPAPPVDAADAPPVANAIDARIVDRPRGTGRLRVNVMPYANVYVDGKLVGEGPVDVVVAAGPHTLVLHNPDTGRRLQRSIKLKPGEELVIKSW